MDVRENTERNRFELPIEGDALAVADYRIQDGKLAIVHVGVPKQYEGQGIASRLAKGMFDILRETDRKAILICPFVVAYARRHPEVQDLVA